MDTDIYRCEASSVEGFIQQLAVAYISNGYFFYVTGHVPEAKEPTRVDAKLIKRYGIDVSKWSRARRKRAGAANLQYLRHNRLFVLLATHGEHAFFAEEGKSVRDVRRVPLKAFGYAVSYKGGHAHVRIEREEFKRMKAHFLELATHRRADAVAAEFGRLPFEPYAPIRRQLIEVLRAVNRARRAMGYELVPFEALRLHRRIMRPFNKT